MYNLPDQPRGKIRQEILLGLAGREEFENELDGQTRPSDHWFAGQDLGIDDNAFRQRHDHILPWQRAVQETIAPGLRGLSLSGFSKGCGQRHS